MATLCQCVCVCVCVGYMCFCKNTFTPVVRQSCPTHSRPIDLHADNTSQKGFRLCDAPFRLKTRISSTGFRHATLDVPSEDDGKAGVRRSSHSHNGHTEVCTVPPSDQTSRHLQTVSTAFSISPTDTRSWMSVVGVVINPTSSASAVRPINNITLSPELWNSFWVIW